MQLFKAIVWIQSLYILATAVWPIVHIASFMEVTGPKTDIWLVTTVGALLIPVAACLLSYLAFDIPRIPALILGGLTCIAFIAIDFYYAFTDVIADIYLVDGILQIAFLIVWVCVWFKLYR